MTSTNQQPERKRVKDNAVDQQDVRSVWHAQIRRYEQPHTYQDCKCQFEWSGDDDRHRTQRQEYVAYDTHLLLIEGVRTE